MKNVKVALSLSALAAVFVMGWIFIQKNQDGVPTAADSALQANEAQGSVPHTAPASFTTGTESLPPSLQGTDVGGELEVGADGHLKITNGIRRLFDYFLSAVGEEPLEVVLKRIRTHIQHRLAAQPAAAAEAARLLDSYVAYKRGLSDLPKEQVQSDGTFDVDALRRQLQQVQALRTQFFSSDVLAAFFGDEAAYDRYNLARMELLRNRSLTAAQRARQLAALEEQLPAATRESMEVINQVQNLDALTTEWKKRGGSFRELRQIREELVGTEAADRLETLDKVNADWDQRMNSWYSERAAILSNSGFSDQDKQRQVDDLRRSRFSEVERTRVESLERIRDGGHSVSRLTM